MSDKKGRLCVCVGGVVSNLSSGKSFYVGGDFVNVQHDIVYQ